jgi:arabinose-5-phosphate isomerase
MAVTTEELLDIGKKALYLEQQGIEILSDSLDDSFIDGVFLLTNKRGKIVFSGVGKSGLIAKKLAATFTSVGLPSVFIHPSEAAHGDLGLLERDDVFVAISNSGETEELLKILPTVLELHVPILAITSNKQSTLATHSNTVLLLPTVEEACPIGLAPTTSTTCTLALGDALACACAKITGLTKEKFAFSHPAGRLGRRLTLRVSHVMRGRDESPIVPQDATLLDGLSTLVHSHVGCFIVVDENSSPVGIFTEGDLCRYLKEGKSLVDASVLDVATKSPKQINEAALAYDALELLRSYKINQLIVTDESGKVSGLLHIQQLIDSKI